MRGGDLLLLTDTIQAPLAELRATLTGPLTFWEPPGLREANVSTVTSGES